MASRTTDPPVSQVQRSAMGAAASGHSNIGIRKSVGAEFIEKDPGGHLPEKARDTPFFQVGTAGQTLQGEGYAPVTSQSLEDIERRNEDFWRQRAAERPLSDQPDYRRPQPVAVYHDRFRGDVGPNPEPLEPIHPPLTGKPEPLQVSGAPDGPLTMKNLPVYKDRFRDMVDQVTPTMRASTSPAPAPMSPSLPTVTAGGPVMGAVDVPHAVRPKLAAGALQAHRALGGSHDDDPETQLEQSQAERLEQIAKEERRET